SIMGNVGYLLERIRSSFKVNFLAKIYGRGLPVICVEDVPAILAARKNSDHVGGIVFWWVLQPNVGSLVFLESGIAIGQCLSGGSKLFSSIALSLRGLF